MQIYLDLLEKTKCKINFVLTLVNIDYGIQ